MASVGTPLGAFSLVSIKSDWPPQVLYLYLRTLGKEPFWLTSCGKGWDSMGVAPTATLKYDSDRLVLEGSFLDGCAQSSTQSQCYTSKCLNSEQNISANIESLVTSVQSKFPIPPHINSRPGLPGFYGYFSYAFNQELDCINAGSVEPNQVPTCQLGFYATCISFQKQASTYQVAGFERDPVFARLVTELKRSYQSVSQLASKADNPFGLTRGLSSNMSWPSYQQSFDKISDYILNGDTYQVNLAQRFESKYQGDPFQAFLKLCDQYPAPYTGFMEYDWGCISAHSPELFLQRMDNKLITKPIKGTLARVQHSEADALAAQQLLKSNKNQAENLMIVDLLRNDLGRSCLVGSIQVEQLCGLETYRNVHHLVSTISGTLDPDTGSLSAFFNAFPGGSITGAPKRRAMEIINELEPHSRETYCGSLGYIDLRDQMQMNVNIRSLLFVKDKQPSHQGRVFCWGGGGIVSDSTARSEYEESLVKIQPLLETLKSFSIAVPDQ